MEMMERRKTGSGTPMGTEDYKRIARSIRPLIDDPEAVGQALEILAELESTINLAVADLHAEGYSWTEIARALKITRQAARQRWERFTRPAA